MALTLNGSSQYAYRLHTLAETQASTLAVRFKTPSVLQSSGYPTIISMNSTDAGYNHFRIAINPSDEVVGSHRTPTANKAVSGITVVPNTWYLAIFDHDGAGAVNLYVDSNAVVSTSGSVGSNSFHELAIGAALNNDLATDEFEGSVIYAGFWTKVLSSGDRTNLINGANPNTITDQLLDSYDLIGDLQSDAGGTILTAVGGPTFDSENPISSRTITGTCDLIDQTGLDWVLRDGWNTSSTIIDVGTGAATDGTGAFSIDTVADAGTYFIMFRKSDGSLVGINEAVSVA